MTGERVTKVIAAVFHLNEDQVTRDVKLDAQLDCNGTAIMDLADALEGEFQFVISDDEADAWLTIGDVMDFVVEAMP